MDTPTAVLISFQNLLLYIDWKYSHWNMFFFQLSTWTPLQNTMYQSVTLCTWYSVFVERNPFRFLGGFNSSEIVFFQCILISRLYGHHIIVNFIDVAILISTNTALLKPVLSGVLVILMYYTRAPPCHIWDCIYATQESAFRLWSVSWEKGVDSEINNLSNVIM